MENKYQEALKELYKQRDERYKVFQKHKEWSKEIKEYDKVGDCLQTLQELVDKETPKKPIERLFEPKKHFKVCPNCWEKDIKTFVFGKYCDECGQRLE